MATITKAEHGKASDKTANGRPTINAEVEAFAEICEERGENPLDAFDPDESITVTLGELWVFVSAVRAEETGWDSWVAAEAVKQMLPARVGVLLYAFFKERATRHAMLARAMGKPPTINPGLSKWLHGNPQIKPSAK